MYKTGQDFRRATDSELIMAVRQRMAEHPAAALVLNQLAESMGITVRQLSAAFERNLGVSVAVYIRTERLRTAQRLLLQTSKPIQSIARELGFSGPANFSSFFREFTGLTPSDFRKNPPEHLVLTTSGDVKWGQGPV